MKRRQAIFLISAALVALVLEVFFQVTEFGLLNVDDDVYVTDNSQVKAGLSAAGIKWAFQSNLHGHWHPLTWISHMLDVTLFGLDPAGHHATNLVLHILTTLLLFLWLESTTKTLFRSALVAAFFAVHPLHVETVAWVADRKDILAGFFFMLTLWAYLIYTRRPTGTRHLALLLCFALGLMSKSIVIGLPVVLLLLDYWPLDRLKLTPVKADQRRGRLAFEFFLENKDRLTEKAGLFTLVIVSAAVTYFAMRGVEIESRPLSEWWITDPLIHYVTYLGKLFWPVDLTVFHPYRLQVPFWEIAGSGLLLLAITALAVYQARQEPYLIVGWLWYLIVLLPVIGLIRGGPHKLADRYTYIALIGMFIFLVWGVADLFTRWRYRLLVLWVTAAVSLTALTIVSWNQTRLWRDSLTLHRHAVAIHPNNWLALNNLGNALAERKRYREAQEQFKQAITTNPAHHLAYYNQGNLMAELNEIESAVEYYQKALTLKPSYFKAHHNLGVLLKNKRQHERAIQHFEAALRIDPQHNHARLNLGDTLRQLGRLEESVAIYEEVLRKSNQNADLHNTVGIMLVKLDRLDEAVRHYEAAIAIDPENADAYNNLGVVRARRGEMQAAERHFLNALRVDPNLEGAQQNLERVRGILSGSPP